MEYTSEFLRNPKFGSQIVVVMPTDRLGSAPVVVVPRFLYLVTNRCCLELLVCTLTPPESKTRVSTVKKVGWDEVGVDRIIAVEKSKKDIEKKANELANVPTLSRTPR